MDVRTYTDARQNLAELMDEVCQSRAPVIISRQKSPAVVMMSLDEYNAIAETLHLSSNPTNARRLRASIAQLDAGKTVPFTPK